MPRKTCSLLLATSMLAHAAIAEESSSEDAGRAERAKRIVTARSDSVARWIDAFFDDASAETEAASSRLELRQSFTLSEREASRYRLRVGAKLHLPNLSRRLSLTLQGNADEAELEDGAAHAFDDAEEDSLEDPAVGLQYIFRDRGGYHSSFSLGARVNNPSINFGPRFRYQHGLGEHWRGRYTERILWDTDDGWESRTRFEFDRAFASGNLFRQALRLDWRESRKDRQGIRYTVKSAFVQRLQDDAALSYEVSSRYHTRPRAAWTAHTVSARYRREFWRDWVFLELTPFVAFEDEFDWRPNPGLRVSVDVVFADNR